jgi:hypothetical protein
MSSSRKEPRQLKELRSLMPWTWDSNRDKHPPGEFFWEGERAVAGASFVRLLSHLRPPAA